MAIAFDAASTNSGETAGPLTFSHTTAAGSNRILIGSVALSDDVTITAASYNSVAMTEVATAEFLIGPIRIYMFRLLSPDTGSNTVSFSLSATSRIAASAMTFTGVNQTTPLGTPVTAAGGATSISDDVTGVNSGELVIDCAMIRSNTAGSNLAEGASQNNRFAVVYAGSASGPRLEGSTEEGTGTVTMSWTWDGVAQYIAHIAVALKPAAERFWILGTH